MDNILKVRRVVTGHDEQGNAVVKFDDTVNSKQTINPHQPELATIWSTGQFPSDNMEETDGSQRKIGIISPGGTVFRIMDIKPGTSIPLHVTQSMDYGIVFEGEVEMELDNGALVTLKKGDVIVQRGTIHAWHNPTESVCRMAFVMVYAEKVQIDN
jgi:quercetin dioxygenase-like cupin family protein